MMPIASLIIPYENRTAFRIGYFSAFISELAAMVSVAQNMAEIMSTPSMFRIPNILLIPYRMEDIKMKPMMLPIMPK